MLIVGLDSQTLSQKEVRMVNIRRAASLSLGGIRHSYGFRAGVCRRRYSTIARLFRAAIVIAVAAVAAAVPGSAQTISDTGSLLSPEDTVLINLALVADVMIGLFYCFPINLNCKFTICMVVVQNCGRGSKF